MNDEPDPNANDGDPGDDGADDGAGAASTPASVAIPPADVRNSPEYKALAKANRKLARDLGNATATAAAARTEAEEARLAAEAQQQAALDAEITAALGAEGVAFWTEFAELSQTDPVAAAKRLADFRAQGAAAAAAQSAAAGTEGDGTGAPAAGEGTTVPASTPPPPSRGVDGGAPLSQQTTEADTTALVESLNKTYTDTVARVQDPVLRNRVTMKDRAAAAIAYLAGAYVQATGNKPRDARKVDS